jgi:hypothetical protein
MPQQDRTGPEGKGSMTGRGQGKYNPNKGLGLKRRIRRRDI